MAEQQKVWVGIYSHRHGDDVCVYATRELADIGRQAIADEWWDREMPKDHEKPSDPEEMADAYFEYMGGCDESFTLEERTIIGAPEPKPQGPIKIKRMISKGELTWEPHEYDVDILAEVARILDKSYVSDALGTVYFEGEDGKFYTVEVLGEIFEVDKEQVDEFVEEMTELAPWGAELP